MDQLTIQFIPKEQSSELILSSFPHNMLENLNDQQIKLLQNQRNNNLKVIYFENGKFQYYGKNNQNINMQKYLIGFVKNKKIKLTEIDSFFQIDQKQKGEQITEDVNLYQNMTRGQKKQLLVDAFGTKKSKQKLVQANSNIVQENNIAGEFEINQILNQKTFDIKKQIETQQSQQEQDSEMKQEFLPEFNLEAKKPEKIYNITSILSSEDFDLIDTSQFYSYQNDLSLLQKNQKFLQPYVYQKLQTNLSSIKMKYLQYLDILLKFVKIYQFDKSIDEISKDVHVSVELLKNIFKKFYSIIPNQDKKIKYIKSQSLVDKLICYIIVLALCINDYKLQDGKLILIIQRELSTNLKLESKIFISYAKEVGCNFKTDKDQIFLELKAPLKLQKNNKIPAQKG